MYGNTVHVLVLPWNKEGVTFTLDHDLGTRIGKMLRALGPIRPVYAVLVEKAGHFRKKLGILDSIYTRLANWSGFSRFRKNPRHFRKMPGL